MKIKEWSITFRLQLGHVLVSIISNLPSLSPSYSGYQRCISHTGSSSVAQMEVFFQKNLFGSIFPLFSTIFTTFLIGVGPNIASNSLANVG